MRAWERQVSPSSPRSLRWSAGAVSRAMPSRQRRPMMGPPGCLLGELQPYGGTATTGVAGSPVGPPLKIEASSCNLSQVVAAARRQADPHPRVGSDLVSK